MKSGIEAQPLSPPRAIAREVLDFADIVRDGVFHLSGPNAESAPFGSMVTRLAFLASSGPGKTGNTVRLVLSVVEHRWEIPGRAIPTAASFCGNVPVAGERRTRTARSASGRTERS